MTDFWQRCQNNSIEEQSFQQTVQGQQGIHMQKNEAELVYLAPHTKINPKWIKDLNKRATTVKSLEEDLAISLYDLRLGKGSLVKTPKAEATQEK